MLQHAVLLLNQIFRGRVEFWILQLSSDRQAIDSKQEMLLNPDYNHFVMRRGLIKDAF